MSRLISKATTGISRRDFLKGSATATAAVAGLSLLGSSTGSVRKAYAEEAQIMHAIPEDLESQGKWVSAACWHNCGGRCLNKALVVDGVVIRQKTDDTHEDTPDYPQQRSCVRGRSQRNQVFSPDRIRKPLKRKGWMPGGGENSNGQMRGKDEWEEIEWDEALDLIAAELLRIREEYGNRSVFCLGADINKLFANFGGYITRWGTTSEGSWTYTPGMVGFEDWGAGINDRFDLRTCETILLIGANPAWSSAGNPAYHALQMKEAGVKFIAVDPYYNDTYALLGAEWIPSRPNCDTALLIGMAHCLITEDDPETNPLIDWEFLDKYTIGFDADHMPEGEDPAGNFKDYVLGTYDGEPKDAEWASKICGVPADKIHYLANEIRKDKKVGILTSWAAGRNQNSDNWPQMVMTIGCMTGHLGKSGHSCGVSAHDFAMNGGTYLVSAGGAGLPAFPNPNAEDCFVDAFLWDAILNGHYKFTGNSGTKRCAAIEKDVDIHCIWHADRALLQTTDGMTTGIAAHRKVDLVVTNAQFMTTNAKYSDFILPVSTRWEREGGFLSGNTEILFMYNRVVPRFYETYSDAEIVEMMAPRLGIDPKDIYPIDEKQQFFNQCAGATYVDENGERQTLISFTQEEIDEMGVEGEPQEGAISFTEYKEKGEFQIKREPGDSYTYIAFKDFIDDPEGHPRGSESGKFEIYSRKLAEMVNSFGFSEIKPIPTWIPPVEGYAATFVDGNIDGEKGEYPYQIMNPHYLRRSHTVFDNVQWLREAWPNPVYISEKDAMDNGIVTGNTVKLTSPRGSVLRTALVTKRWMPGVIGLPHGAWVDVDEETGIDTAGADNYLTGVICTGQCVSGWNTCICNIEKYSDEPLIADVDKPMRVSYDD